MSSNESDHLSGSTSSTSSSDNRGLNISVCKQQTLKNRAELSRYDEVQARAQAIFAKYQDIEAIESGNIEMGTIQDAQDVQSSQNNEVSSRADSGIVILGAGISPRRTRSGKIVNYIAEQA